MIPRDAITEQRDGPTRSTGRMTSPDLADALMILSLQCRHSHRIMSAVLEQLAGKENARVAARLDRARAERELAALAPADPDAEIADARRAARDAAAHALVEVDRMRREHAQDEAIFLFEEAMAASGFVIGRAE